MSKEQKPTKIEIPNSLFEELSERAKELGLTVEQYANQLLSKDLPRGAAQ